jgi:Fic family protein
MSEGVRYHTGKFPPQDLDWGRLVPLLEPVATHITRFDGLLRAVPNPEVLLAPLKTTEATASCRIEGTVVTSQEVLAADSGEADPEKEEEIREVQNYRLALKKAVELMAAPGRPLPLCGTVLRAAHAILLDGQPGLHKRPGEYRTGTVQIGDPARFWPIETEYLEGGMSQWEKYVNGESPSLYIQLAIIHAEFESLHPFMDGNGRMGRMLVPLFLHSKEVLSSPTFYVSEYIEEHRQGYYDSLLAVSDNGDWTGWCEFFLKAMTEQGKRNESRADSIITSYKEKKEIMRNDKAPGGDPTRALDFFFENVEFNSKAFREETGMTDATANRLIKYCVEKGWLECTKEAKGRSPATYSFTQLRELIG